MSNKRKFNKKKKIEKSILTVAGLKEGGLLVNSVLQKEPKVIKEEEFEEWYNETLEKLSKNYTFTTGTLYTDKYKIVRKYA